MSCIDGSRLGLAYVAAFALTVGGLLLHQHHHHHHDASNTLSMAALTVALQTSFRAKHRGIYNLTEPCKEFYGESALKHDQALWPFLRTVRRGFFVESGAFDGESGSNSLAYELSGWDGLLVEPNEENQRAIIQKGRKAHLFRGCLSTKNEMQELRFFGSGQLTTTHNVGRAKQYLKDPSWSPPTTCLPLSFLLAALHISVVDYWILDVEGAECSIIQAFNFSYYEVGVLQMERNLAEQDRKCFLPLTSAGFARFRVKQDDIWVNNAYFERRGLPSPASSTMKYSGEYYLTSKSWRPAACRPRRAQGKASKIPLCPESMRRKQGLC